FVEVDRELRALVARIAQQRFGVWTAAAQPAVWIHGEPAAEDPRQQKQSADDAGPLMPVLPTAILRAQPQDADPDARYREQNAWRRGPQDDLAPQRRIRAQWREVDPMRDGAEPVPESLHARFWNWLGAIPHWIYFTPLRANPPLWRQVVLWASAPGILLAVTGIWIGILRLRTQYRGWKNWHQWSGIIGGLFLLTWIFSGWLSVNPNGWLSGGSPDAEALLRYAGHEGAELPVDFDKLAHESARTVRFFHIDGTPIAALVMAD